MKYTKLLSVFGFPNSLFTSLDLMDCTSFVRPVWQNYTKEDIQRIISIDLSKNTSMILHDGFNKKVELLCKWWEYPFEHQGNSTIDKFRYVFRNGVMNFEQEEEKEIS